MDKVIRSTIYIGAGKRRVAYGRLIHIHVNCGMHNAIPNKFANSSQLLFCSVYAGFFAPAPNVKGLIRMNATTERCDNSHH